jgi:hypothetical protein
MNVRQMANPDKVVDDFLSSMEEAAATKMSENKKIVTEAISADEY